MVGVNGVKKGREAEARISKKEKKKGRGIIEKKKIHTKGWKEESKVYETT